MKNQFILKFSFLCFTIFVSSCSSKVPSTPNMVAVMEAKEPIEGICNIKGIYMLSPLFGKGQIKAVHQMTEEEIAAKLNEEVQFLKDNPNYKDKGMMGLVVNCKGELVKSKMDNKTKSPELDQQIETEFAKLKTWTAGKLNGKPVDSSLLFSFTITGGKIEF